MKWGREILVYSDTYENGYDIERKKVMSNVGEFYQPSEHEKVSSFYIKLLLFACWKLRKMVYLFCLWGCELLQKRQEIEWKQEGNM